MPLIFEGRTSCRFAAGFLPPLSSAPRPPSRQTPPAAEPPTIKPGENLVVEGVPAVPAGLADEVWRYTEFRSASFSSWHPTRREMLISTRFGNTNQAHLVKTPGGARTQMTFFPERVGGAAVRAENGRRVHLFEGHRRQRVLPDLPVRLRRRQRDASDRRQVAQHGREVVARRPLDRLRLDPADRQRRRHLRRRRPGPEERPPRRWSSPAEAGRSPTGHPTTRSFCWSSASRSTRPISGSPTSPPARRPP